MQNVITGRTDKVGDIILVNIGKKLYLWERGLLNNTHSRIKINWVRNEIKKLSLAIYRTEFYVIRYLFMIFTFMVNLKSAVELFQNQHTGDLMGKSHTG